MRNQSITNQSERNTKKRYATAAKRGKMPESTMSQLVMVRLVKDSLSLFRLVRASNGSKSRIYITWHALSIGHEVLEERVV